jgi:hypothetical protein
MNFSEFYLHWEEWWFPVTFIVSTLFVLYYGFAAPWYKTPFGRALITVDLGLAVSTFPGFLEIVFHSHIYDNDIIATIIIVIASFVPVAILYRIVTLWGVRNKSFWKNLRSGQSKDKTEE